MQTGNSYAGRSDYLQAESGSFRAYPLLFKRHAGFYWCDTGSICCGRIGGYTTSTGSGRGNCDQSGDLSVIFSEKNYDIYFASDAFASFLGIPVREILKKKIYEVFGCKDWAAFEQLMQSVDAEENSYFDEKSGRSFMTEMCSVTWEEYHAKALLLHDMTSAVERQKSAEKLYRDRMNFLMSSNENAVYTLYIDMTESKIISGKCPQYKLSINEKGGVRKWLEECIFPHFPFPDDQEKFMKNFEREHLLKCFSEGQTQVEFEYFLYKGEQNLSL